MTIYIDNEYRCHADYAEDRRAFEVEVLEGRSPKAIECYRYVPEGEEWAREDGQLFSGPMLSLWTDPLTEAEHQTEYDRQLIEDMQQALEIMEVTV